MTLAWTENLLYHLVCGNFESQGHILPKVLIDLQLPTVQVCYIDFFFTFICSQIQETVNNMIPDEPPRVALPLNSNFATE